MAVIAQKGPRNFSFSGFLKIIRFQNLVIIFIAQYMTAIFLIGEREDTWMFLYDWKLFALAISTALIAAAGYIINDYYDVKIDFINKPDRVVVGKILKRRIVMVYHTILNISGIALGTFISLKIGLIHFLAAFLLWLYSNYFKRLAFSGNLIIAILTALAIIVVDFLYGKNNIVVYNYALFAFLVTLIREIIKDMEDLRGDENFGCKTLPIVWGIRKTKVFIYSIIVLFAFTILFSTKFYNNTSLTIYFFILSVPVVFFIYKLIGADTVKEYNYLSNYCKILMMFGIISMIFL
jgi:4-hydroxybenzoate polyprenyltransferase